MSLLLTFQGTEGCAFFITRIPLDPTPHSKSPSNLRVKIRKNFSFGQFSVPLFLVHFGAHPFSDYFSLQKKPCNSIDDTPPLLCPPEFSPQCLWNDDQEKGCDYALWFIVVVRGVRCLFSPSPRKKCSKGKKGESYFFPFFLISIQSVPSIGVPSCNAPVRCNFHMSPSETSPRVVTIS